MKWEEIEKQYKGEWVFVEVTKASENHEVLEGEVLCYGPNEETLIKEAKSFHPKAFAIRHIGEAPKDLA